MVKIFVLLACSPVLPLGGWIEDGAVLTKPHLVRPADSRLALSQIVTVVGLVGMFANPFLHSSIGLLASL
jgi:hypothetical protein